MAALILLIVTASDLGMMRLLRDSQEAIIPKDLFIQAQEEMLRRQRMYSSENRKRRVYSSKYALSSICTCSKCGDIYRRIVWNNRGKRSIVWRCCTRVEHGPNACDAETISEIELQAATVSAINQLICCSDSTIKILLNNVKTALTDDNEGDLASLNEVLSIKQKELVKMAHEKKDYTVLADEIDILRDRKQELLVEKAENEGFKKRIKELETFLIEEKREVIDYDETLVRRYINGITIYDDHLTISFKAGIDIDIEK